MGNERNPVKGAEIARIIAQDRKEDAALTAKNRPEIDCGLPHWGQTERVKGRDVFLCYREDGPTGSKMSADRTVEEI